MFHFGYCMIACLLDWSITYHELLVLILQSSSQHESTAGEESTSITGMDSMSSQGARTIYAKEANIIINYKRLGHDLKEVRSLTSLVHRGLTVNPFMHHFVLVINWSFFKG